MYLDPYSLMTMKDAAARCNKRAPRSLQVMLLSPAPGNKQNNAAQPYRLAVPTTDQAAVLLAHLEPA